VIQCRTLACVIQFVKLAKRNGNDNKCDDDVRVKSRRQEETMAVSIMRRCHVGKRLTCEQTDSDADEH